jgi:DNA polymerase-3 subunit gamma/tau
MLGLADRGRVMDLFDLIMRGDAAGALLELGAQYSDGADPLAILRDLAELTHWVSVVQITPDAAEDPTVTPDERARGQGFAEALQMRSLTRMWQMLLKALEEVAAAPNAMMAAEMAVIRLTHVADLPSPDELIAKLRDQPAPNPATPAPAPAPSGGGGAVARGRARPAPAPEAVPAFARFATFPKVVDLIRANRDVKLLVEVETGLRLAAYAPGRIEFEPAPGAAPDLAARLAGRLQGWTGARWVVSVVSEGGAPTIAETRDGAARAAGVQALAHPLTQSVLAAFPGAELIEVRTRAAAEDAAAEAALEEVEDEWDPFDET